MLYMIPYNKTHHTVSLYIKDWVFFIIIICICQIFIYKLVKYKMEHGYGSWKNTYNIKPTFLYRDNDIEAARINDASVQYNHDLNWKNQPVKKHLLVPKSLSALTSSISLNLIAMTISVSGVLFFLLLFEAINFFPMECRSFVWFIELTILVSLIYIILPIGFIITSGVSLAQWNQSWYQQLMQIHVIILMVIFTVIVIPFVLSNMYLFIPFLAFKLHQLIARIGLCGVIGASILSGLGSIELPLQQLLLKSVNIPPGRLDYLKHQLSLTEQQIERTHIQILSIEQEKHVSSGTVLPEMTNVLTTLSWISRFTNYSQRKQSLQETNHKNLCHHLQNELDGLQLLKMEQYYDIQECLFYKKELLASKTFLGQLHYYTSLMMMPICIYRILSCLLNLCVYNARENKTNMSSFTDPCTTVLKLIYYRQRTIPLKIAIFIPYMSFIILSIIILLTIKNIIHRILTVLQWLYTPQWSECLLIGIAEAIAFYSAAYILLLYTYLPATYQQTFIFNIVGTAFNKQSLEIISDVCFVMSAFTSVVVLLISHIFKQHKYSSKLI